LIVFLSIPEIRSDRFVAVIIFQIIANMFVYSESSALFQQPDSIPKLLIGCTFDADDRLGFHLLCAPSNFTFHNCSWSPPELIDAVPVAVVSQHVPSVIEALPMLCNLATAATPVLVSITQTTADSGRHQTLAVRHDVAQQAWSCRLLKSQSADGDFLLFIGVDS
jgi:hypothetical protein